MGKITQKIGVIGNFFTENEEVSPGQALARVNKSTDANDFALRAIDGNGNSTTLESAVALELIDCDNVAAVKASVELNDQWVEGTPTTSAWQFDYSTAGGAMNQPIDTEDGARKGSTLIDQILDVKTRPAGFGIAAKSIFTGLLWSQSENKIFLDTLNVITGAKFAEMTASASGRDFGE